MNRDLLAAGGLGLAALLVGLMFADDPFRLKSMGLADDQLALAHRDSPYAHITWVVSPVSNYAELRFFDKVEGGVCLRPTWSELSAKPALAHLAQPAGFDLAGAAPGRDWPKDEPKPNPGSLPKSPYINLLLTGVLLDEPLMAAAGHDSAKVAPRILVVGLGSGIGIACLAHHFPQASITVVDIDRAVVAMVREHYPLIRGLEAMRTADGRPRLQLVVRDARQFARYRQLRPAGIQDDAYDLIIVDAYTDGSTIPPHLMTREFYGNLKDNLRPGGIVLSNIIGSYTGPKRLMFGGALRSMQAAGLTAIHSIPIITNPNETFDPARAKNNIVLASASPLTPQRAEELWSRLASFTTFPELPLGTYENWTVLGISNQRYATSEFALRSQTPPELLARLNGLLPANPDAPLRTHISNDATLRGQLRQQVLAANPRALGWNDPSVDAVHIQHRDWVQYSRAVWRLSVQAAMTRKGRAFAHGAELLVGAPEASAEDRRDAMIPDAPLFTDAMPNADIYNL